MPQEEEEFKELLKKYESGQCSEEEIVWLESWYLNWNQPEQHRPSREELDDAAPMMWKSIAKEISGRDRIRLWPRIAVAAAAVAAITFGTWLYTSSLNGRHPDTGQDPNALAMKNDIAPGRNTATLTLANGKIINLDTNKTSVVVRDSLGPSKPGMTKEFGMTSVSTPRGGTYRVTLPDGSDVWLNADSKISFSSSFEGAKQRKITLQGEAYFQVARDKARPFIVKSREQEVEVLGTHFNINSYADERSIKTTLLEGSVRVNLTGNTSDKSFRTLVPGQQSILSHDGVVKVEQVDTDGAMSWKNGYFRFNDEKIDVIMTKLARWYDIEVVYEGKMNTGGFTGTASRNKNISQVLRLLENTKDIHFKIEGRRVTVIN